MNNIIKKVGNGKTYEYVYYSGNNLRIKNVIEDGVESNIFGYDASGNIRYYKSNSPNLFWTRGYAKERKRAGGEIVYI